MLGRSAVDSARSDSSDDDAARGASLVAPLSDDELVAAAQGGDRNALDSLLRRHYDRIYAVCRRVTGGSRDADDACQEALIKITRSLPRFDGRSTFGTWAYRIATNASLDELRKRKRRPLLHSVQPGDGDDGPPEPVDPMAARRVDAVADRLAIDDALGELSDDYKAAVVLRDVGDLDYDQIADILEIPIGTVKSRIARGRAALADTLQLDKPPAAATGLRASKPTDVTVDFSDPGNQDDLPERPTDSP